MQHPVPAGITARNYGIDNRSGDLMFIVCRPLPDGRQPCPDLAQLAKEIYDRVRCRVPGCDGTR